MQVVGCDLMERVVPIHGGWGGVVIVVILVGVEDEIVGRPCLQINHRILLPKGLEVVVKCNCWVCLFAHWFGLSMVGLVLGMCCHNQTAHTQTRSIICSGLSDEAHAPLIGGVFAFGVVEVYSALAAYKRLVAKRPVIIDHVGDTDRMLEAGAWLLGCRGAGWLAHYEIYRARVGLLNEGTNSRFL